jgi:hypothetical protein
VRITEKEMKKNKRKLTWAGPLGGAMLAGRRSLPQRAGDRKLEKARCPLYNQAGMCVCVHPQKLTISENP